MSNGKNQLVWIESPYFWLIISDFLLRSSLLIQTSDYVFLAVKTLWRKGLCLALFVRQIICLHVSCLIISEILIPHFTI